MSHSDPRISFFLWQWRF